MAKTVFKNIPTRDKWADARDDAGGSSGLVSKVSVGKLLDAYETGRTKGKKVRRDSLEALKEGLVRYTADKSVKKIKDLHDTAMSIFNLIEKELLALDMDRDIGLAVGRSVAEGLGRLEKVVAFLKAKKFEDARAEYERFYDGIGRGIGKILPNGDLRDDWEKTYKTAPSREDVTKIQDLKELVTTIKQGVDEYRAALNKLFDDAEKAGYELKL